MPSPAFTKHLHPKRLTRTLGAVAGLFSALSAVTGLIAARSGPHGFAKLKVALHLAKEPFIVKLATGLAAIAVAAATGYGVLNFYLWWRERDDEPEGAPKAQDREPPSKAA